MKKALTILVIEDNQGDFILLEALICSLSLNVQNIIHTTTLGDALTVLPGIKPDIIFLDLFLPDSKGLNAFKNLYLAVAEVPTIVLSGLNDIATSVEALSLGAQDYLVKGGFDKNGLEKSMIYSIERKRVELKAISSEEKYRQIFYNNPLPTFIYNTTTSKILECNVVTLKEYGYTREEFLDLTIQDIVKGKKKMLGIERSCDDRDKKKEEYEFWHHKKKNGEIMFVVLNTCAIEHDGFIVCQVQVQNVTKQIKLQKKLECQQKQKQHQITQAAVNAQEKERNEIGREMHDNINQLLAAANLYISFFLSSTKKDLQMVMKGKDFVNDAMKEIRAISKNLVPPSFLEEEFIVSLEQLMIPLGQTKMIKIETSWHPFIESMLNNQQKLSVYRIIQEQTNNIIKHAAASLIKISLNIEAGRMLLSVKDDGKGCIINKKTSGIGLQNITNRARLHNGSAKFVSQPDQDFELQVLFKLRHFTPNKTSGDVK